MRAYDRRQVLPSLRSMRPIATRHTTLSHWRSRMCSLGRGALGFVALIGLLTGCTTAPRDALTIDSSYSAVAHSSRVRHIVLHYTVAPLARSIALLTGKKVSSHYLITDERKPRILQLVDESRAAWHTGRSSWYGSSTLNATTIGIEIVNPGYEKLPSGELSWTPYTDAQIERTIALVRDIATRHGVSPDNIVGHSDIAPQRKVDPGPLFPWRTLAQAGIGRWFDEGLAQQHRLAYDIQGTPDTAWFQRQLDLLGYATPRHGLLDTETRRVIAVFQMHYRPSRYDGMPDTQTAAILATLTAASARAIPGRDIMASPPEPDDDAH